MDEYYAKFVREANQASHDDKVIKVDRDLAAALGEYLGVPDIKGPRNQETIARFFAAARLRSDNAQPNG